MKWMRPVNHIAAIASHLHMREITQEIQDLQRENNRLRETNQSLRRLVKALADRQESSQSCREIGENLRIGSVPSEQPARHFRE